MDKEQHGEEEAPISDFSFGSLTLYTEAQPPSHEFGGVAGVPSSLSPPSEGLARLNIDIVETRVVEEGTSNYVVYKLKISTSSPGSPTTYIERRYSDIAGLHQRLRKAFPALLADVVFPKKLLTGNFKPRNIAKRSQMLEQFITHVCDIPEIRHSGESLAQFPQFFYLSELQTGLTYVGEEKFAEAVPILLNVIAAQCKFLRAKHPQLIMAVCALVVAYEGLDKRRYALSYAIKGLEKMERSGEVEKNELYFPLLTKAIRLSWELGEDKTVLEGRLEQIKQTVKERASSPLSLKDVLKELKF